MFQAILLSPGLPQWGLKFTVPAAGALLALAAALAAACFVRAYGIAFLGRVRSHRAAEAHEADRFSLTAMYVLAAFCLIAGILPGIVIDELAPVTHGLVGARMPVQLSSPWLSIVPVMESRSSYNGLLVFLFGLLTASLCAYVIHRVASNAIRRAPPWDCGYPDATPATQYSGDSFAQPLRRVFGTVVFRAREAVEMPPPLDPRPARFLATVHDLAYEWLYAPVALGVTASADWLNRLQFLTIRQYLSLVFCALISLLTVLALWP
jgi:NADH:ubiquinone oxidoreductase subunit 5 (subunit L)/multisubunit Na+/H+ antiporter MnhA subunit